MSRQQRRMIANATEARTRQRLPADPCVGVCSHDELRSLGDRSSKHILGIFEQVDRHTGFLRRERQSVIGGGRNHARDFGAIVAQRFEYLGPKEAGPDQCALHRGKAAGTVSTLPGN